jgi:hypothetical protein
MDDLPIAVCKKDGEPVMATFRYPGAEFVCMVCGSLYGYFEVDSAVDTPELAARHDELKARFDAGETPGGSNE